MCRRLADDWPTVFENGTTNDSVACKQSASKRLKLIVDFIVFVSLWVVVVVGFLCDDRLFGWVCPMQLQIFQTLFPKKVGRFSNNERRRRHKWLTSYRYDPSLTVVFSFPA